MNLYIFEMHNISLWNQFIALLNRSFRTWKLILISCKTEIHLMHACVRLEILGCGQSDSDIWYIFIYDIRTWRLILISCKTETNMEAILKTETHLMHACVRLGILGCGQSISDIWPLAIFISSVRKSSVIKFYVILGFFPAYLQ